MPRKAVVTGGSGFIGANLCEALLEEGYEVHSVDIVPVKPLNAVPGVIEHRIDIGDTDMLRAVCEGASFVFHCAALPRVPYSIERPQESNRANIDGTLSALLAARDAKVQRFVYSASSSAYGNQKTLPLSEAMRPDPLHPYGLQKYVGEEYCRIFSSLYGLSTVSLRYFNVYGPRLNPEGAYALVIGIFLRQRKEGKPLTITGDGLQTRDFTHVSDVVRANILAATSSRVGRGEVINIGAGRSVTIQYLAFLFGGEAEYIPARVEAEHSLADRSKAKELLGWEPLVSLEEGIRDLQERYGILL